MFRGSAHQAVSPVERVHLRRLIEAVERETGVEIAALVVPRVDDLERFAKTYFDHVGIGKHGHNNGILILIAMDRRMVRIEIGRGLAAVVPPHAAQRIIDDVIVPQCRLGRYGAGLLRGVEAVGHLVRATRAPVHGGT